MIINSEDMEINKELKFKNGAVFEFSNEQADDEGLVCEDDELFKEIYDY